MPGPPLSDRGWCLRPVFLLLLLLLMQWRTSASCFEQSRKASEILRINNTRLLHREVARWTSPLIDRSITALTWRVCSSNLHGRTWFRSSYSILYVVRSSKIYTTCQLWHTSARPCIPETSQNWTAHVKLCQAILVPTSTDPCHA
jgi:hypothetical protein